MANSKEQMVSIEGRAIKVSNLEKVLYPGGRFTKANVIDYYVRVAPFLLPHLKNRPVTLKRFPDGVYGDSFYEKDAPSFTPPWVKTFAVPRKNKAEPEIRYILINNLPTLVWLANLANLEIHPFLHRVPKLDRPTAMRKRKKIVVTSGNLLRSPKAHGRFPRSVTTNLFYQCVRWRRLLKLRTRVGKVIGNESRAKRMTDCTTFSGAGKRQPNAVLCSGLAH